MPRRSMQKNPQTFPPKMVSDVPQVQETLFDKPCCVENLEIFSVAQQTHLIILAIFSRILDDFCNNSNFKMSRELNSTRRAVRHSKEFFFQGMPFQGIHNKEKFFQGTPRQGMPLQGKFFPRNAVSKERHDKECHSKEFFFQGMPFPRNFYFYYKLLRISL